MPRPGTKAEKITGKASPDEIQLFLDGSVTLKVSKEYQSLLRNLSRNGWDCTHDGFIQFAYAGPYKTLQPASFERVLTALNHFYATTKQRVLPENMAAAKKAVTSYAVKYRNAFDTPITVKGTINEDKLQQLDRLLRERDVDKLTRLAAIIQWGFSLRCGQVDEILRSNFTRRDPRKDNTLWTLTLPLDKLQERAYLKHRKKTEKHDLVRNRLAEDAVAELFAEMNRRRQTDPKHRVFPNHKATHLNRHIKAAAEKYDWNTEFVIYDGAHCLRSGGIEEAFETLQERHGITDAQCKNKKTRKALVDETRKNHSCHRSDQGISTYLGDHDTRHADLTVVNNRVTNATARSATRQVTTPAQAEAERRAAINAAACEDAKKALRTPSRTPTAVDPEVRRLMDEYSRQVCEEIRQDAAARRRARSGSAAPAPRTPVSSSKATVKKGAAKK